MSVGSCQYTQQANGLCCTVGVYIPGLFGCPSYAHSQLWALWTSLHQLCLLVTFAGEEFVDIKIVDVH